MFVAGQQRNQKRGYKPAVTETTKRHFQMPLRDFQQSSLNILRSIRSSKPSRSGLLSNRRLMQEVMLREPSLWDDPAVKSTHGASEDFVPELQGHR